MSYQSRPGKVILNEHYVPQEYSSEGSSSNDSFVPTTSHQNYQQYPEQRQTFEDISQNYPAQHEQSHHQQQQHHQVSHLQHSHQMVHDGQGTSSQSVNGNVRALIRDEDMAPDFIPSYSLIDTKQLVDNFWRKKKDRILAIKENEVKEHFKHMALPMARVKKIMRIDDDVRQLMIAGDAPFFLANAAEIFIEEITTLAWHVVEEGRRRTMQKSDVVAAFQRSEQYDFLIDLIPRDKNVKRSYNVDKTNEADQIDSTDISAPDQKLRKMSDHIIQDDQIQMEHTLEDGEGSPGIINVPEQSIEYVISHDLATEPSNAIYIEHVSEPVATDEHGHLADEIHQNYQYINHDSEVLQQQTGKHNVGRIFQISQNGAPSTSTASSSSSSSPSNSAGNSKRSNGRTFRLIHTGPDTETDNKTTTNGNGRKQLTYQTSSSLRR